MKITQFIAEPSDFFIAGNPVLTHAGTKFFDTGGGKIESSLNQCSLFPLILTACFRINQAGAKIDHRQIVLEELGQVK